MKISHAATLIVLIVVLAFGHSLYRAHVQYRKSLYSLTKTEHSLRYIRLSISNHVISAGKPPESLSEIILATPTNLAPYILEYLSDSTGTLSVVQSFDNTGGWFYDPTSGNVRINITIPLGKYNERTKHFSFGEITPSEL
jgi:hypothetical protein